MQSSIEIERTESDNQLIRDGAIRLAGEQLFVTPEQIEEIKIKMEADFLQQDAQKAETIIMQMDTVTFVRFQRELQYALRYWHAAFSAAEAHIFWNDGEQQKTNSYDYYSNGKECCQTILESTLYKAVRKKMTLLYAQEIPAGWVGWLDFKQTDVETIVEALRQIFDHELPTGILFHGTSKEESDRARQKIASYGIEGIFIEDSTERNLLTSFLAHFRQNQETTYPA